MKGGIKGNHSTTCVLDSDVCNGPGNAVLAADNDLVALLHSQREKPVGKLFDLLFCFLVCIGDLLR